MHNDFPRRTFLGSLLHSGNQKDGTTPFCVLTLAHMCCMLHICCRNTAITLVPVLLSLSPLIPHGHQIFSHSPTHPHYCQRESRRSKQRLKSTEPPLMRLPLPLGAELLMRCRLEHGSLPRSLGSRPVGLKSSIANVRQNLGEGFRKAPM